MVRIDQLDLRMRGLEKEEERIRKRMKELGVEVD
jgi:chaperonin cofactor prefoldin